MEESKKTNWISIVIITIIAVGGFILLRKNNAAKHKEYFVYYSNVKGLQQSSAVVIKGVRVGKIKNIDILENKVKVTISVGKELEVPKGTIASLVSGGMLSDKSIQINLGKDKNLLPPGSTIYGMFDSSVMDVSVQVMPYIITAKSLLRTADSTLQGFTYLSSAGMLTTFMKPVILFETNMKSYGKLAINANKKTGDLSPAISGIRKSSDEMASNKNDLNKSIKDAEKQTASLAARPLSKEISSINASIKKLSATIRTATSEDSGMGKLLNKKDAYVNANSSMDTLQRSLKSTYDDPPGFQIFGKSKKKK